MKNFHQGIHQTRFNDFYETLGRTVMTILMNHEFFYSVLHFMFKENESVLKLNISPVSR